MARRSKSNAGPAESMRNKTPSYHNNSGGGGGGTPYGMRGQGPSPYLKASPYQQGGGQGTNLASNPELFSQGRHGGYDIPRQGGLQGRNPLNLPDTKDSATEQRYLRDYNMRKDMQEGITGGINNIPPHMLGGTRPMPRPQQLQQTTAPIRPLQQGGAGKPAKQGRESLGPVQPMQKPSKQGRQMPGRASLDRGYTKGPSSLSPTDLAQYGGMR